VVGRAARPQWIRYDLWLAPRLIGRSRREYRAHTANVKPAPRRVLLDEEKDLTRLAAADPVAPEGLEANTAGASTS